MNSTQLEALRELVKRAQAMDAEMNGGALPRAPEGDDYNRLYALVHGMARIIMRPTVNATAAYQGEAEEMAAALIRESVSFMVEPECDDVWTFTVKDEHAQVLRLIECRGGH